jgi:hypothetical protein
MKNPNKSMNMSNEFNRAVGGDKVAHSKSSNGGIFLGPAIPNASCAIGTR